MIFSRSSVFYIQKSASSPACLPGFGLRSAALRAGLRRKERSCFATFAARLKPCPDTCLTQGRFSFREQTHLAAEPNPRHPASAPGVSFFLPCRGGAIREPARVAARRVGTAQVRRSINGKKTETLGELPRPAW